MKIDDVIDLLKLELESAERKHPCWPTDPIHAAAIVAEESGELIQAAIDYVYAGKSRKELVAEAIQTAAMGIQFLINIEDMKRTPAVQVKKTKDIGG